MAETGYLASALVTGVLLLAVWVLVVRMENWRSYEIAPTGSTPGTSGAADSPTAWMAGFFLLALVAGGGAVLLVSGVPLGGVQSWVVLAAVFGVLLVGYLVWGTYLSVRNRGLPSAQAALVSTVLFGTLGVAAIAVKLLVGGA